MKLIDTAIEAVKLVQMDVYGDARGFFVERYNENKFRDLGLPTDFKQDNHSRSAPGVIRGLHYQHTPPQGKLVGCAKGRIWDVAVDIRPDSPTYGQHVGAKLSDENGLLLWMPAGFAHGFCVLGDNSADVLYKCTATYNPEGETGMAWDDPELAIAWPLEQMQLSDNRPIISGRDSAQPAFGAYRANPVAW